MNSSKSFERKTGEMFDNPDIESMDVYEFKDGRIFERYSRPQQIGGEIVGRVISHREITERKKAEERIKRLYDFQMAVRRVNQVLLRAKSESELFQQICDSLEQIDYIKFIWIGLVEKSGSVKPVTYAGFEEGYLSAIKVTKNHSKYSKGPMGSAIKTGKPYVIGDSRTD